MLFDEKLGFDSHLRLNNIRFDCQDRPNSIGFDSQEAIGFGWTAGFKFSSKSC